MSLPYLQNNWGLSNGLQTMNAAGSSGVGGWVELGRTTLGSTTSTIDISSLADKRYYMILSYFIPSGTPSVVPTFNADTGSNYAFRYTDNGGSDSTSTSTTNAGTFNQGYTPTFSIGNFANLSTKEKLCIFNHMNRDTAGAATAPARRELVAKWTNTSDPIDEFTLTGTNITSGSEVVVLGWDPTDTHTTNFWEELASVDLGSAGDNLSSGTISAKKYLWFQAWLDPTGGSANANLTFNNDTGSNYSLRYSVNGAVDSTLTSEATISMDISKRSTPFFINGFIVNNTTEEKLCIIHQMNQSTVGAATAPIRVEIVGKWANTAAQITEIDIDNPQVGVDYATGSKLRVWGSD